MQLKKEKSSLTKITQEDKNHKLLRVIGADCGNDTDTDPKAPQRSMWDHLKRYKSNHMTSSIPDQMYDYGSENPKSGGMSPLRKPGPLTPDPLVWHRFRFALGHSLIGHKESPYDETEARRIA